MVFRRQQGYEKVQSKSNWQPKLPDKSSGEQNVKVKTKWGNETKRVA